MMRVTVKVAMIAQGLIYGVNDACLRIAHTGVELGRGVLMGSAASRGVSSPAVAALVSGFR
jgi:hypothetical protein